MSKLNPFKKPREAEIVSQLKTSVADRDRIERQIADAEQEIVRRQAVAVDAVVTGAAPEVVDTANSDIAGAERSVKTARAALAQVESRIVELERERDTLANKRLAGATSGQIDDLMQEVAAANADLQSACARLATIGRKTATFVPEAATLETFGRDAPAAIGDIAGMVRKLMRDHQRAVLTGNAPPTIRSPDEPAPRPKPTPEPTTTELIAMTPLAWSEGVGVVRAARGQKVRLPNAIARHAMQQGAAEPIGKYEASELHSKWVAGRMSRELPPFGICCPLDDGAKKEKAAALNVDLAEVEPKPLSEKPSKPAAVTYTAQPKHAEKIMSSHAPQFTPMPGKQPYVGSIAARQSPIDNE